MGNGMATEPPPRRSSTRYRPDRRTGSDQRRCVSSRRPGSRRHSVARPPVPRVRGSSPWRRTTSDQGFRTREPWSDGCPAPVANATASGSGATRRLNCVDAADSRIDQRSTTHVATARAASSRTTTDSSRPQRERRWSLRHRSTMPTCWRAVMASELQPSRSGRTWACRQTAEDPPCRRSIVGWPLAQRPSAAATRAEHVRPCRPRRDVAAGAGSAGPCRSRSSGAARRSALCAGRRGQRTCP